jgi:hypothetical protein
MDRRTFMLAAPALMAAGCVSVGGVDGPPAPAPVFRIGDRWVYNCADGYRLPVTWVETHEVSDRFDGHRRARHAGRRDDELQPGRAAGVARRAAGGSVYDDAETRRFKTPLTRYQFPLTSGQTWNQYVDEL